MIIEWLMQLSASFQEWVATLMPPMELPDWLLDPFVGMEWILDSAAGWMVWVNVPAMAAIVIFVFGVYGVTAAIKLVRAIIAHVPFIGGNG